MKKINLDAENLDDLYFHYTNKSNIVGIEKKGLLPKIGKNSKYIEFRRKIFFSKGEKPTLKIIDIWIKWLNSSNGIGLLYGVGAYLMRIKWIPQIFFDTFFYIVDNSKARNYYSVKEMDKILNESVYLVLDLEEDIDFDPNDFDDVKLRYSKIRAGRYYTAEEYDNAKMVEWNMHTKENVVIHPKKIKLACLNGKGATAKDIIKFLYGRNKDYVDKELKYLKKYVDRYL